jgi:uncharacterized membrane protein
METLIGGAIGLVLGLVIGIVVLFILGLVLKWLWNTTMPAVFGLKEISTVQAIKLMFIAALIFGGNRAVTIPSAEEPPVQAAALSST